MINVMLQEGNPPVPIWIDVVDPTTEELFGLAENYALHPALVQDCMQPAHLPKHEDHGDTTFVIVRHYDGLADAKADSVQSMTKKIALFLGDRFLITIHRQGQTFIETIAAKYRKTTNPVYLQVIMIELLMAAVETYHRPLEETENRLHQLETSVLRDSKSLANWDEVFRIKCRLSVIKRLLWHSLNTVQKFIPYSDANASLRQDLRERIENLQFFSDSLLDDLNNLLNIQLSLVTHKATEASNRTNEVMKVLTIFSAFFLPLNFIVGIYGMNFKYMPELEMKYGYYGVLGLLLITVIAIYHWFVRKRWIRMGHLS